jgi:integrase
MTYSTGVKTILILAANTPDELRLLFTDGLLTSRDRALFGICLYTGCRVSEALALQTTDIKSGTITFRKSTTKGKLKTHVVDIQSGYCYCTSSTCNLPYVTIFNPR